MDPVMLAAAAGAATAAAVGFWLARATAPRAAEASVALAPGEPEAAD
jgi:hypothetical protein